MQYTPVDMNRKSLSFLFVTQEEGVLDISEVEPEHHPILIRNLGPGESHNCTLREVQKHMTEPFCYVHIDAHCDTHGGKKESAHYYDFVTHISRLPLCKTVAFFGDSAKQILEWKSSLESIASEAEVLVDQKVQSLPDIPTYISTDLDVLKYSEIRVPYGCQGSMTLEELKQLHIDLFQQQKIICADNIGFPVEGKEYEKGQEFIKFQLSLQK